MIPTHTSFFFSDSIPFITTPSLQSSENSDLPRDRDRQRLSNFRRNKAIEHVQLAS